MPVSAAMGAHSPAFYFAPSLTVKTSSTIAAQVGRTLVEDPTPTPRTLPSRAGAPNTGPAVPQTITALPRLTANQRSAVTLIVRGVTLRADRGKRARAQTHLSAG